MTSSRHTPASPGPGEVLAKNSRNPFLLLSGERGTSLSRGVDFGEQAIAFLLVIGSAVPVMGGRRLPSDQQVADERFHVFAGYGRAVGMPCEARKRARSLTASP
jgi:hypothetical protein